MSCLSNTSFRSTPGPEGVWLDDASTLTGSTTERRPCTHTVSTSSLSTRVGADETDTEHGRDATDAKDGGSTSSLIVAANIVPLS
eukprot:1661628-Rhodomonas_salina.2